jgi:hypothetical protein
MRAGEKHRPLKTGVITPGTPLRTVATCPCCGGVGDIWSEDGEVRCRACDRRIIKTQRTSH